MERNVDKNDPRRWENRPWLLSMDVPEPLVRHAMKLMDEEERLREQIAADDLSELICDVFADNLRDSYAIEGEQLNSSIVKSSLIRQMGLNLPAWTPKYSSGEREAEATAMALTLLNDKPLTHEMIIGAHAHLSDMHFSGRYRQGDEEEIIRSGREIVYFAPPPHAVRGLMDDFIEWWNDDRKNLPPVIGAAIGHSIFVIIHPFGDGNGRVARALTEKGMITGQNDIFRPYALSTFMLRDRGAYYKALGSTSQLDFIDFMLGVYENALRDGFEKARSLQFLRYYLGRADFSLEERAAIRKMVLMPRAYWEQRNFDDTPGASAAWDALCAKGVITASGEFDMEWRNAHVHQVSRTEAPKA